MKSKIFLNKILSILWVNWNLIIENLDKLELN